jgi:hypothetical protein
VCVYVCVCVCVRACVYYTYNDIYVYSIICICIYYIYMKILHMYLYILCETYKYIYTSGRGAERAGSRRDKCPSTIRERTSIRACVYAGWGRSQRLCARQRCKAYARFAAAAGSPAEACSRGCPLSRSLCCMHCMWAWRCTRVGQLRLLSLHSPSTALIELPLV